MNTQTGNANHFCAGWASEDITPDRPVGVAGQFHARRSEGVLDPITVTALAMESAANGQCAILISCDLVSISDNLRDAVRAQVKAKIPEFDATQVFLNATHTHTAPYVLVEGLSKFDGGNVSALLGVELDIMDPADYVQFAAGRMARAAAHAWQTRAPVGMGFGIGQAVVGHNRRISYYTGETKMYGNTNDPAFSHIEGYEDHAVNLLCIFDPKKKLIGMIVNLACPAQVSEMAHQISADYWHDTRLELRKRFGADLFILPQNSASGDQSPHVMLDRAAEARMLYLKGLTDKRPETLDSNLGAPLALRKEIALRIADTITAIMPAVERDIDFAPAFAHIVQTVDLSRRDLTQADVDEALADARKMRAKYEELRADLETHPEKKNDPRWYVNVTAAFRRMKWCEGVADRFALQQKQPRLTIEVHVLRLGGVAIATNPFEYYVDFGMQIKARSPATQTFLVQHVGVGTYLPSDRAVAGKSYGAVPASTPIGPQGGRELVEWTVKTIGKLWLHLVFAFLTLGLSVSAMDISSGKTLTADPPPGADNWVKNGDFKALENGLPEDWAVCIRFKNSKESVVDPKCASTVQVIKDAWRGKNVLKIVCAPGEHVTVRQFLPLLEGDTRYQISAWVRMEQQDRTNLQNYMSLSLRDMVVEKWKTNNYKCKTHLTAEQSQNTWKEIVSDRFFYYADPQTGQPAPEFISGKTKIKYGSESLPSTKSGYLQIYSDESVVYITDVRLVVVPTSSR